MKTTKNLFWMVIATVLLMSCTNASKESNKAQTNNNGVLELSNEQIENIVRRSYQYVALYNVNNKFAISQGGWNSLQADTQLKDHTLKDIARPNNDTFYSGVMLDLRDEPQVISWPAFDSKYVSLMVTAYDHYVNVPRSTRLGDFSKAEKVLFYSDRTKNYNGEAVDGIDDIIKVDGDFAGAVIRVMPHVNQPEVFAKVVEQIQSIEHKTLSEYLGQERKAVTNPNFPEVGTTNADVYENNFVEVMQFVVNHLTFDLNDEMDREFLAAMKTLGVEPGKEYVAENAVKIDTDKFRKMAEEIQAEYLAKMTDGDLLAELAPLVFKTKGNTSLEAITAVSVIGPIGLPLEEAFYPAVSTTDGEPMNAKNDYVIKMTADELPPAKAFWSLTLYDKANGFFIPNEYKKYSVGENAGMQLNEEGGIDIYVSAEKPEGVPAENWLPINRGDEEIDIILRVYVPELAELETWTVPAAEKL